MGRFAATALAIIVAATCALAQTDRVLVIRDDDGTADDGRGQVTSERSVCRKTIILDQDPASVTRAWVMYFMKVQPYDVATRKLYKAPVEGVEWADLIMAVNGTEVLRGSLIEHGTIGWHEVEVDPALLVRGANEITLTLDRGGSYFYLGIDRAARTGRSASSRDGGKTFRERWLSFANEEADDGEYMVRLKIMAPEAEQVGFTEKDGQSYGWVELEDLFSETEAHSSGFKAIEYTKGVNQPSAAKVAYHGAEGQVSFPLQIPIDRQWRLWMRVWLDGFRGGKFTLSVDGREQYDSAGHEFSSDDALRFDWLDLGEVHLGEGTHSFELQTTGQCGHMFDVFALTTDMGYVPDETDPLPRMTALTSLVAGPGLAKLEPGLFATENPQPMAKPLAGGSLRTVWVCGDINESDVVELQRRMDMEADVISSPTNYYGKSVFGNDLNLDQGDLLYEVTSPDRPLDVVVLVRAKLDQIPEHALTQILARVDQGMGLIVVQSRREGEQPTALSALLTDLEPLDMSTINAPFDLSILSRPKWREYGEGRIVYVPHCLYGTMDRVTDSHELHYPWWDYQFAAWMKMLIFAGRRDAGRITSVQCPETVAPGETAAIQIDAPVAGGTISGALWSPLADNPVAIGPIACAGGAGTVELPAATQDGLHRAYLILTDAEGNALDVASAHWYLTRPIRIAGFEAACSEDGSEVVATVTTESQQGVATLPVHAEVIGAHNRLLGSVDVELSAPADAAELSVPVIQSYERLVELRLTVPDEDGPVQRLRRLILRPQTIALDDYTPYSGVWENREVQCYMRPLYMRMAEHLGMKAIGPSGVFWHSLNQGFATALPYRLTSVGSATGTPEGVRVPCLHDAAMWAREEPAIRERTRNYRRFSPLVLGLGDEMELAKTEVCFSDDTLAAFRAHLQDQYQTVAALNAAWQTDFTDWNAVGPWRLAQAKERPANIAPFLAFREFMTDSFMDAIAKMNAWVREEAPECFVGGCNPWDEGWTTCTAFSRLYPLLQYGQIYPRSHDVGRSWFRDPRLIGMWSGYGRPRDQIEREAWLLPTYGGTLMGWYGVGRELGYGTLTGTLGMGPRAEWMRDCNMELTSGIGKLLIEAEVAPEPVAILHSWRSRFAHVAIAGADLPDAAPGGLDQRFDQYEEGFVRLLRELRVPYRFVDEGQVEDGALDDYQMLIAPRAWCLNDRAVEAIEGFALDHPVVCDLRLGGWDEIGREREHPVNWPTVDGADVWDDAPAQVTDDNLARLRASVEAAGVTIGADAIRGDISFVVRKTLGELDMLVIFGKGPIEIDIPEGRHAYDARAHDYIGAGPTVKIDQPRSPAALVFSDEVIGGVSIRVDDAGKLGKPVNYTLSLPDGGDTVANILVVDPEGAAKPWHSANLRLSDGRASGSFVPALNAPEGTWTIRARDIVTGAMAKATVQVSH